MKFTLIVVQLLFIATQVLGFDLKTFQKSPIDWSGIEETIPVADKAKLVQVIISKYKAFEYVDEIIKRKGFDIFLKNFHLVDIDQDGLSELIFSGNPNSESDYLLILQRDKAGFRKVFDVYGALIKINLNPAIGLFTFRIHNYSCCDGYIDHFYDFATTTKSGNLSFINTSDIAVPSDMKFPESQFSKPIAFVTEQENYKLRLTPYIDNDVENIFPFEHKGNSIADYPKGSQGFAISEKMDSTGRIWWLVIMKNNIKLKSTIFYEGSFKNFGYYSVGWMSSRYLKKL